MALLGRGGMGEVYRADDLTLGQPVALKFLPEDAGADPALLERFRNEVRIARRVSHPNVCRVYDVGEVEGHTFFTMEYIDGEDLASLLRRIGRLPADKALEMARQLCAGLAAAHAKGVLHRDLKPANIMLDGRGQVVITDFGLAGLADQISGAEVRSGTPAYMAPEQLAGKEVTALSDIYSLGLVLYEIFTGKRAFDAENLAELVRARSERQPSRPSTLVKDLDPAVERAVLRCLEAEPAKRPTSVMSVAAALPGGDPLAAALAAGETPSPEMVAAAGEKEGLKARTAVICMAAVLVALAVAAYLTTRSNVLGRIALEESPDVLNEKARDLLARFGYPGRALDSFSSFEFDTDFINYVQKNEGSRANWNEVFTRGPAILRYWYRQSPQYMSGSEFHDTGLTPGMVTEDDPPPTLSGMVRMHLDPKGQLTYFEAIPPQRDETASPSTPVNWGILFQAAGLDRKEFETAQPTWAPLSAADERAAWTGKWPGTNRPVRIEAAAWHGKPVFFSLVFPWTHPDRMQPEAESTGTKARNILSVGMLFLVLLAGVLLARRNYRQDRGDRQGASRLAYIILGLELLLWLCRSRILPTLGTFGYFVIALSTALFFAALVWVFYLAVEPYVRRHWPHSIISWTRALSGKIRDPLVGRDVLFGVIVGLTWILLYQVYFALLIRQGDAATGLYSTSLLENGRAVLGAWLLQIPNSITATLMFFMLLLVLKIFLRREWLAAAVFVLLTAATKFLGGTHPQIDIPLQLLVYSVAAFTVVRFGLLALGTGFFVADLLLNVPLTADLSSWFATNCVLAYLSIAALAAWAFYASLGGQPLWTEDLLK